MIPLIGKLYRRQNVIITLFGDAIVNKSPNDILGMHETASTNYGQSVTVSDTFPIIEALSEGHFKAAHRIDVGTASIAAQSETSVQDRTAAIRRLVREAEEDAPAMVNKMDKGRDVVLYGFGRIGRLLARLLIEKTGSGSKLLLRAIVVRKKCAGDLIKRAELLQRDSIHGKFEGKVSWREDINCIVANGNLIQVIYANRPAEVDYTKYDINDAIIIDNTGIWRDRDGLGEHLKAKGASKVILTAPGKGDISNVVAGVNCSGAVLQDTIVSAASCTTNAIAPILKVMHDQFGIDGGHLETVHAFTNDQNLTDNFHAKERRGRAGPLNMVLTETGAGQAVGKCLPELVGKLTANAIRVPTPNVSMAVLVLNLKKDVTKDEINSFLRQQSLSGDLQQQIGYTTEAVVSTDMLGDRHPGIVDSIATIAQGKRCNLYVWYDNEFGYSCQVVRVLQAMAGIKHAVFPKEQ